MPYVMLTTDPETVENGGALPAGFDVLDGERDDEIGNGQAVWVVTHADDATLVAEIQTERAISWIAHGSGTWDGGDLARSVSGIAMAGLRGKLAALDTSLMALAVGSGVKDGLRAQLASIVADLPADPRA